MDAAFTYAPPSSSSPLEDGEAYSSDEWSEDEDVTDDVDGDDDELHIGVITPAVSSPRAASPSAAARPSTSSSSSSSPRRRSPSPSRSRTRARTRPRPHAGPRPGSPSPALLADLVGGRGGEEERVGSETARSGRSVRSRDPHAPTPRSRLRTPPLVAALKARTSNPTVSFHVPWHKHGVGASPTAISLLGSAVYRADLTEVDGLDLLAYPNQGEPIAEAQVGQC